MIFDQRYRMTPQAIALQRALEQRNVLVEPEHYDGHKHVDMLLPEARIYIEVDGLHHWTDARQIMSDLERAHFSSFELFDTIHVPNDLVVRHLGQIADAIAKVVNARKVAVRGQGSVAGSSILVN